MYAITFFTLIEESLKLDGIKYSTLAQISALPHMKRSDAKKFLTRLQEMTEPRKDDNTIDEDRKRLRKLMMGKRSPK